MHRHFVNLPVKDLNRPVAFLGVLGCNFNPDFTNENAAGAQRSTRATPHQSPELITQ